MMLVAADGTLVKTLVPPHASSFPSVRRPRTQLVPATNEIIFVAWEGMTNVGNPREATVPSTFKATSCEPLTARLRIPLSDRNELVLAPKQTTEPSSKTTRVFDAPAAIATAGGRL